MAIDGASFHGNASKASIKTRKRLECDLAALDADIEAYALAIEANDAREQSGEAGGGTAESGTVVEQIDALKVKRAHIEADIDRLWRPFAALAKLAGAIQLIFPPIARPTRTDLRVRPFNPVSCPASQPNP